MLNIRALEAKNRSFGDLGFRNRLMIVSFRCHGLKDGTNGFHSPVIRFSFPGVPSVVQWVKNPAAAAWGAGEVQV